MGSRNLTLMSGTVATQFSASPRDRNGRGLSPKPVVHQAQGMRLMPWMKPTAAASGSPVISMSGSRAEQLLEHHPDLAAGEVGAEAEVRTAGAEPDVLVRRAGDVEAERVGELALVAVGRVVEHHDLLALLDLLPADLGVPRRGAAEVDDRRRPAHDLLDRGRRDARRSRDVQSSRWSGWLRERVACRG